MVPHKSRLFCAILDLAFILKLIEYKFLLVNETTEQTAPSEAMNQIGGALPRIIAAMAEASNNKLNFFPQSGISKMVLGKW